MKKEYVLPVCFAAAAHGALLFGFSKTPRPVTNSDRDTILTEWKIPPQPEEVVAVEPESTNSTPKSALDVPQPIRSPEPPVLDIGDRPPMPMPPISAFDATTVTVLPTTEISGPRGDGKNPWGDVVSKELLDNPPHTRFQATPMYPREAVTSGRGGTVVVEFMVDERGNVVDPHVVSSTDRVFEDATLRAVAKWKFEPGRRDGRIVRFRMSAPVVFNLND